MKKSDPIFWVATFGDKAQEALDTVKKARRGVPVSMQEYYRIEDVALWHLNVKKDYDAAARAYSVLAEIAPTPVLASAALGCEAMAEEDAGRLSDAITYYTKAIEVLESCSSETPGQYSAVLFARRGLCRERTGDIPGAIADYELVINTFGDWMFHTDGTSVSQRLNALR